MVGWQDDAMVEEINGNDAGRKGARTAQAVLIWIRRRVGKLRRYLDGNGIAEPWIVRNLGAIVGTVVLAALASTILSLFTPGFFVQRTPLPTSPTRGGTSDVQAAAVQVDIARLEAEDRRSGRDVGLKLAAGLAALSAGLLAWARHEQSRRDTARNDRAEARAQDAHMNQRFAEAVMLIANESPEVKLGGLFAMEQLTVDSRSHAQPGLDVICAFIRGMHEPEVQVNIISGERGYAILPLTQAALTIVGRSAQRRATEAKLHSAERLSIDLSGANLVGAQLRGTNLCGANLRYTKLCNADFTGANLEDADLTGADLQDANFTDAVADRGSFVAAGMQGANFLRTSLNDAWLSGANCDGASFFNAKCRGAHLDGIGKVKQFYMSDLTGANLTNTDVSECNFYAVTLDEVFYTPSTIWPTDFTPPESAADD
jgi:hypothetical protein